MSDFLPLSHYCAHRMLTFLFLFACYFMWNRLAFPPLSHYYVHKMLIFLFLFACYFTWKRPFNVLCFLFFLHVKVKIARQFSSS